MTVYSRADVQFVGLSAAHGGCGQPHLRPDGVVTWALTCGGGCEDFLRHDPLWATTIAEIPETPDAVITREDWEKRGAADQQYVMAMALASIAGVEIPESLSRVLTGRPKKGKAQCAQGHPAAGDAKFCPECGGAVLQPVSDVVRCGAGHPNHVSAKFCSECAAPMGALVQGSVVPDSPKAVTAQPGRLTGLKEMKADELRAACRVRGLDAAGTRAIMIARLRAAQ